jgi:hypothetical protein
VVIGGPEAGTVVDCLEADVCTAFEGAEAAAFEGLEVVAFCRASQA